MTVTLDERQIIKRLGIKKSDRVLDIGGSMKQHELIQVDTLVDLIHPEDAPYGPSPLKAKYFVKRDITAQKLPFKDKEFDVCLCTHTLEDLPTPFLVIKEMERVAKRGLVITPEMGMDMVFSKFSLTDWLTGPRRVPGLSHHKWLFYIKKGVLQIMPKNYGVLYSSDFHFTSWIGPKECSFFWDKTINYRQISDLNVHKLIFQYKAYIAKNRSNLRRGLVLVYFDNPATIIKELIKIFLKRGRGFDKLS